MIHCIHIATTIINSSFKLKVNIQYINLVWTFKNRYLVQCTSSIVMWYSWVALVSLIPHVFYINSNLYSHQNNVLNFMWSPSSLNNELLINYVLFSFLLQIHRASHQNCWKCCTYGINFRPQAFLFCYIFTYSKSWFHYLKYIIEILNT
jgi:hypothetical protein